MVSLLRAHCKLIASSLRAHCELITSSFLSPTNERSYQMRLSAIVWRIDSLCRLWSAPLAQINPISRFCNCCHPKCHSKCSGDRWIIQNSILKLATLIVGSAEFYLIAQSSLGDTFGSKLHIFNDQRRFVSHGVEVTLCDSWHLSHVLGVVLWSNFLEVTPTFLRSKPNTNAVEVRLQWTLITIHGSVHQKATCQMNSVTSNLWIHWIHSETIKQWNN